MASVIACPKCSTRLKLNKPPAEAAKIQCPQCKVVFAVGSSNGVTARPAALNPHCCPRRRFPDAGRLDLGRGHCSLRGDLSKTRGAVKSTAMPKT